jgi:hypothetical protein
MFSMDTYGAVGAYQKTCLTDHDSFKTHLYGNWHRVRREKYFRITNAVREYGSSGKSDNMKVKCTGKYPLKYIGPF